MIENWKAIEDYPGYEISDLGRVKGPDGEVIELTHKVGSNNSRKGQTGQYYSVDLWYYDKRGKRIRQPEYVHRLVAKAFVPNPHGKKEVNHIDHNKENNKATNLDWVTRRENILLSRLYRLRNGPPEEMPKPKELF